MDPVAWRKCLALNPDIKCAEPPYEFCEFLDAEYKEADIRVRHSEAVIGRGAEDDVIRFRTLPETRVLSIFHKDPYENIGEAYAYILNYAKENGWNYTDFPRECYIDGIWNKESPEEWLTEIQLPIEK